MEEEKKAYSEVVEILKVIEDEKKLEKIPYDVVELIKSKSDTEYKPKISGEVSLEEQDLQEQTYKMLSWLAIKFWDGEIPNIIDEKNKATIAGAYNDIDQSILYLETSVEEEKLPILMEKVSWYKKIGDKITRLFKMVLGIDKS